MSRRVLANLVVFAALMGVMVMWAVDNVVSVDRIERPYAISASFENAFGVLPNAEVTYLGVSYGTVRSVTRDRAGHGVVVHMLIKRGQRIPEGSTASILRKSALGEQYVDFEPPPGREVADGPWIAAGSRIPRERTRVPLEFSELLRSASALVASIPPEDVHTLVHELAVGLQGRADSLRRLTQAGDEIGATLAARTAALDRLATNNTRITKVLADHRQPFGQSLTDLRLVAAALRESEGDLRAVLDRSPALLRQTADLVASQKGNLDCDLKTLERVIREANTPIRIRGLQALLGIGPRAFAGVWDSRDVEADGPWIRVGLIAQPSSPPAQYQPPRELPTLRQVPACTSPLAASGIAYRPSSPASPATSPASGGVAMGLVALVAGVALRSAATGLRSLG